MKENLSVIIGALSLSFVFFF